MRTIIIRSLPVCLCPTRVAGGQPYSWSPPSAAPFLFHCFSYFRIFVFSSTLYEILRCAGVSRFPDDPRPYRKNPYSFFLHTAMFDFRATHAKHRINYYFCYVVLFVHFILLKIVLFLFPSRERTEELCIGFTTIFVFLLLFCLQTTFPKDILPRFLSVALHLKAISILLAQCQSRFFFLFSLKFS